MKKQFDWISSHDAAGDPRLKELNRRMTEFYQGSAVSQSYHATSEAGNGDWSSHPLQREVLHAMSPGEFVVEFNCGSGYACALFQARGARYLGLDVAVDALKLDGARKGHLLSCQAYETPLESGSADFVASFFSIEHMVWPERYLEEMLRVLKRGGRIALAFPDYLERVERVMPSVKFGLGPGGLREKLRSGRWLDAAIHAAQRRLHYRPVLTTARHRIYAKREPVFLVNLSPVCLESRYESDTDAVYFASEEEIAQFLTSRGCELIKRSADVLGTEGQPQPARVTGNGFVMARKK